MINCPSFKSTGVQFWIDRRGNRKILVAKKSQRFYLRRGKGQRKKHTSRDILDQLRKLVSSDAKEEDEFTKTLSPEPRQSNQLQGRGSSSSTQESVEEKAAKMLSSIFNCSICLSQCKLPAAAFSSCYAVIVCAQLFRAMD